MARAEDHAQQFKKLANARGTWDDHFERLAEIFLPRKRGFTGSFTPGQRRMEEVFDSVPMTAARKLASQISSLVKPSTDQWFHLRAVEPELNRVHEVKEWLEDTENRMFSAIYSPKARFQQGSGEADLDLVIFGTAGLFVGESANLSNLFFKPIPLRDLYLTRDAEGAVDTVYIRMKFTARGAEKFFRDRGVSPGPTAAKAIEDKDPDREIVFLQILKMREERNPDSPLATDMPVMSLWIDAEAEVEIQESGFEEWPLITPTWEMAAGEDYGRSPAMFALADANTLMAQGRTVLKAGQKIVDPPLMIANDSIVGSVRTFPGSNTYFDLQTAKTLGRIPIEPMNTGANIPIGREMQNDTRAQVRAAFFAELLNLPVDRPEMTATEVMARLQERVDIMGPIFGTLESEYVSPMINRVFSIMFRAGALAPPPPILQGRDVEFEYVSPIARNKRQLQSQAFSRVTQIVSPLAEVKPAMLDNFDEDEIMRGVSEAEGLPFKWMKDPEEVARIRQARAQRQQQQESAQEIRESLETGAKVAKATQQ